MKYILIAAAVLLSAIQSKAQTIDEARTKIYYHRYESAKALLKQMIAKGEEVPDASYWLGTLYINQQMPDSAAVVLNNGLQYFNQHDLSKKKYPLIHIGQAYLLLEQDKKAEARKLAEDALEATRYKDVTALWAAARANIDSKNGDRNWALELLDKAIKRDKDNPQLYTAKGDAYRKFINGSEAVQNYMKAYAIDPHYAEAMYREGMVYKTQDNDEVYTKRFLKAVEMDSLYLPAIYELYIYYFYRDLSKAGEWLSAYIRNSDATVQHDYLTADYLYLNKKYSKALGKAAALIASEGQNVQPRIYKLMAYSQAALNDSAAAGTSMKKYFEVQLPEEFVPQDYDLMAKLAVQNTGDKSAAIEWYGKGLQLATKPEARIAYMTSLAETEKELGNFAKEAAWREQIYTTKTEPSNLDVYRWGVAVYMSRNYHKADSIFAMYTQKYPEQLYGYLWQARSNAAIDTAMEKGLAVPYYIKLAEIAGKDSVNNKYVLLDAYGYLGSYEANITKDYSAALQYFEKILLMEPDNEQTLKYAALLKEWIGEGKGTKDTEETPVQPVETKQKD